MDTTTPFTLLTPLHLLLILVGAFATAALPTDFISSSCSSTLYPNLCFQCLSSYAPIVGQSPLQLARAALTVSANRARSASKFVSRIKPADTNQVRTGDLGAMSDCLDNLANSVNRLKQSIKELGRFGQTEPDRFSWHLSNVDTWCSAALTNENTCLDSLATYGSTAAAVRAAARQKVVEAAQVTSNALALVNRIRSGY